MAYRLCLRMGGRYRDGWEVLEDFTPAMIAGWLKYYEREPWGFHAADLLNGVLIARLLQPYAAKGTRLDPVDYMVSQLLADLHAPEPETKHTEAAVDRLFGANLVVSAPAPKDTAAAFDRLFGLG